VLEVVIVAFAAGALTILAPCILPLLPIVVGGSVADGRDWRRPIVIAGSLMLSVIAFTLLLKASTAFLGVPQYVWQYIAGGLIIVLGIALLFPRLWEPLGARLNIASGQLLGRAGQKRGYGGAVLTGAALGPVFNSCSPTYAFILAAVLPSSFAAGLGSIVAYAVGLGLMLLLIGLLGQRLIAKLGWAANPNGWFRRTLGVLFILVGIFVATSLDRQLQTYIIDQGWYDPIAEFERSLFRRD
jgi:cytochrome c biogenesis protein CcdA